MNRKIVGWKFKEDCKQFEKAALVICKVDSFFSLSDGYVFQDKSQNSDNLLAAGVLSLWFEPVYEEKFKVGDWVKWDGVNPVVAKILRDAGGHNCWVLDVNEGKTHNSCHESRLRLATPAEIEAASKPKLPKIGGYQVEINGTLVVCGCTTIFTSTIKRLYEVLVDVNAERITIKGESVSIEQISQIAKAIESK